MRRSVAIALAVVLAACGADSPPVPTTIAFTPGSLSFDAIGSSSAVNVVVKDERGRTMDNASVTWSASGDAATLMAPAATSTAIATHTATVASSHEGEALITATSGSATATLHVVVDQVASAIVRVSGDNQIGAPSAALIQPVSVQVIDRGGAPVAGEAVTFAVVDGGGSVSQASVATNTSGIVAVNWTLGTGSLEHLSASIGNASATPVTFTARAVEGGVTGLIAAGGGNEAIGAGGDATPPRVKVVNAAGVGVPGILVAFSVTAGGGSISASSAVSGTDGVAALTRWTMGPVGALNEITASVLNVPDLTFDDAGCDNPASAPGFTIALCYRTTMTASQRQAFVSAAARWSTIITNDLPDIGPADFSGACGGSVQSYKGAVDDLLIFATIEPIDGAGQIVGSAGPCIIRNSTSLPVIGTMRFDVADVVSLESRGLFDSVILHEMGHVLGIGVLWQTKGLLQNPSSASSSLDTFYSGTNGIAGFDEIGGTTYTGGSKVPVENTGGAGTINGHWREAVLRNELMTGTINSSGGNPLSALTVRSLVDLGYTVNTANEDPFFLTLSAQLSGATTDAVVLDHDVLVFPLWTIDTRGRLTRVPR